jgi:hypothetical protein
VKPRTKALLSSLNRRVFSPEVPAERLAALRILVHGYGLVYLLVRAGALTHFSEITRAGFLPVGVWWLLGAPLPPWLVYGLFASACLSGAAATLGYRYRHSAPCSALLLLLVVSYRNCWGMIFHTDNLLVLHALLLSVVPAADAHSVSACCRNLRRTRQLRGEYAWPVFGLSLITVLSYWVAGYTKLKVSGFSWGEGEVLRTQIAFDALRKIETGSQPAPFAAWLVQHPLLCQPLSLLTLALELLSPLALLGGNLARLWCAAAWGFHASVILFMLIVFPYPLSGLAFASFFALERGSTSIAALVSARFRRQKTAVAQ